VSVSPAEDAPRIQFRPLWIFEKAVASFEPIPFTTAMIATEIPAAMSPYSMAVAPDSFFAKRENRVIIRTLLSPLALITLSELDHGMTVVARSVRDRRESYDMDLEPRLIASAKMERISRIDGVVNDKFKHLVRVVRDDAETPARPRILRR
jgi:hypothetical protein